MSAARVFSCGGRRGAGAWQAIHLPAFVTRLRLGERRLGLGQIAGVDVSVIYTWPIFALVTIALTFGYLPGSMPNFSPIDLALLGILSVLLLFGSVLVHELSHSLVAKARGLGVRRITLFVLGGYTEIEGEVDDPVDEILIFLVGPLTSLALAGSFFGLGRLPNNGQPVLAIMPYLATINLVLAIVNLVPGLPMDGGRVLRAAVWKATGSALSATYWTSVLGQVFALVLLILGIAQLASGGYLGGVWNLFIAWFLNGAALSSRRIVPLSVAYAHAAEEAAATALLPADVTTVARVEEDARVEP